MSCSSRFTSGSVALLAAAFVASLAACTGDERLAPVDGAGGGGATTASATTGGATSSTGAGAGTPVREILVRNPMGDQVGNLLADGDFELSITSNPGQHGWTFFGFQGSGPITAETGGLCRSGLRCAVLPANGVLFGRGTAAAERQGMLGEVWVKPLDEGVACAAVSVYAVSCDSFAVLGSPTLADDVQPDGWCARRWAIGGSSTAVCLYLENEAAGRVLVDQASVRAREDEATDAARAAVVVPAATRARMDGLREHLRRTLPIGRPADEERDVGP